MEKYNNVKKFTRKYICYPFFFFSWYFLSIFKLVERLEITCLSFSLSLWVCQSVTCFCYIDQIKEKKGYNLHVIWSM